MDREELREALGISEQIEIQATGCCGVGGYRRYAANLGYTIVKTLCTSSSAGDWSFLVSKDGFEWQVLSQQNNWPHAGFSYGLDSWIYYGTFEEVAEQIASQWA